MGDHKLKIRRLFNDFLIVEKFLSENFSSPTHWPEWNLLISKYYHSAFFYFVAYDNDLLVGICPAHKVKNGKLYNIFSGQFHFLPNGGWIFKQAYLPEIFKLPLLYNESFISFSLPVISEFDYSNLFKTDQNGAKAQTLVVNLNKTLEDIWKEDIQSKRRNMIRKAEKTGITISKLSNKDISVFYDIYTRANTKYGLKSLPKEFFIEALSISGNIKFQILVAKLADRILNVLVLVYDMDYSYYWLGFSEDNIPNNGQGDLLQWEAIKLLKEKTCHYYDLCYIEKERLPHIYKFKSGFSKNEVQIPIINQKPLGYKIINKLSKWS